VAGVARLGAYATGWVRAPEEWVPEATAHAWSQWGDLLRHLLARYPVPRFLDGAWAIAGSLEHFERDCWCAIAQGRSLRAVPGFPRSVPRRVIHLALISGDSSQRNRGIAESIWRAQLRALNASPELEKAVLDSRIPREWGDYRLWWRLAAKFAAAKDVAAEKLSFVANTLVAVGAQRGRSQVEQLMKLPLRELIRHGEGFARRLIEGLGYSETDAAARGVMEKDNFARLFESSWPPLLGSDRLAPRKQARGAPWVMEELCSVAALEAEGRVLRHCVARYAADCRSGRSAIFSVRRGGANEDGEAETTSFATVEVLRPMNRIVQIRAFRNGFVNNTIMGIVRDWAADHDLVCAM
jgi:hypothetical protein